VAEHVEKRAEPQASNGAVERTAAE
jgi:hypothetical protein